MSESTEPEAYTLGDDYAQQFAAADASLEQGAVHDVAANIIDTYRTLLADPATQPDTAGVVSLRFVRAVLNAVPRELFDAAVRFFDSEDRESLGFPFVELTAVDEPTPADLAAVVFTVVDDEVYLVGQLAMNDEDLDWTRP